MTQVTENDARELIRFIKEENAYVIVKKKIIPFYNQHYKSNELVSCILKICRAEKQPNLKNFFNKVYFFKDWSFVEGNNFWDNDSRYRELNNKWMNKF